MKKHNHSVCNCYNCRSKREFKPHLSNCLNCNIEIKRKANKKFCSRKCFYSYCVGDRSPNYKNGNTLYKICIDCGTITNKNGRAKRCRNCNTKYLRTILYKHHIRMDGNDNNILMLTNKQHLKLHHLAYNYLVNINKETDYIKWFIEKYGTQ